jgi:hypothetical protein
MQLGPVGYQIICITFIVPESWPGYGNTELFLTEIDQIEGRKSSRKPGTY